MRTALMIVMLLFGLTGSTGGAQAQANSCKVCTDQQRACMKNYAGPTCRTEYQMCIKSCKPK